MTPPDSDHLDIALMMRLAKGDDLALNELMTRWQQPLVNFICRYSGSANEALDLAQETFVRVFEGRRNYRPKGKFSTWLFTIASNLCRNHFRWRARHPTIELDAPDTDGTTLSETVPSESESPSDTANRSEIAAAIKKEVQALPHDLKTTILLFEYENLSYEEIAKVLGCSAKAVETRLYRARSILRKELAYLKFE